mgnify:FL=1|tara:strand:+ start:84 stop:266 length:183 start_codon:yes stop_codon:yes gene_type:complete
MQKKITSERQERISIETPYGTIESDSGNHLVDIATVVFIILVCVLLKLKGALLLKRMFNK